MIYLQQNKWLVVENLNENSRLKLVRWKIKFWKTFGNKVDRGILEWTTAFLYAWLCLFCGSEMCCCDSRLRGVTLFRHYGSPLNGPGRNVRNVKSSNSFWNQIKCLQHDTDLGFQLNTRLRTKAEWRPEGLHCSVRSSLSLAGLSFVRVGKCGYKVPTQPTCISFMELFAT